MASATQVRKANQVVPSGHGIDGSLKRGSRAVFAGTEVTAVKRSSSLRSSETSLLTTPCAVERACSKVRVRSCAHSASSTRIGTWSEGLSSARRSLSIVTPTRRSAACGESSR